MQGLVKEKFKWGFDVEHQLWNDLYTTREELQKAEERDEGRINWDRWDKTVEKTKKLIEEELKHYTSKKGVLPTLCVYDLQGNLIQTFPSTKECAAFYGISTVQVNVYVRSGGTYKKRNIKFKKEYK